jgi:hypothetical protein
MDGAETDDALVVKVKRLRFAKEDIGIELHHDPHC